MRMEDFNNIDFKNAGSLPVQVKLVMMFAVLISLMLVGYWFLWKPVLEELDVSQTKEQELRSVFLDKKKESIALPQYKQQMVDIKKTFGALLKQLPNKSEMDGLLTDINQAGLARGLEFDLFKPGAEVLQGFYAEVPIAMRVIGTYENFGGFASDVAKLSRIVTLSDISLTTVASTSKDPKEQKINRDKPVMLTMEVTAKTYRYLDPNEIAEKAKADKAAKPAKPAGT